MPARTERAADPQAGPLFHRTFRAIAEGIERGEHAPGDRLPSERWFSEQLGVSRTTVRRAFDELVATGAVVEDGRGLLVPPRSAPAGDRLVSLTELANARGLTVSARVRRFEVRPATLDEADAFGIAPGSDVVDLERVRLLDGMEVSIDHDRLPLAVLPDARDVDFATASLYAAVEARGTVLAEARTQIEAAAASASEARLLGLAPGAPVLVTSDRTVDRDGRVVSLGRTVFRSDRHRFLATFVRRAEAAPVPPDPSSSGGREASA